MKPLRIQGLPIHPALVHFPVAGWTAVTFLLAATALGADEAVTAAARWCNVAALVTGLAAMAAGIVEVVALPRRPDVRDAVVRHMLLAVGTWFTYLLVLLFQVREMHPFALAAAVAGLVLLLFTGHAGARLVYPHGLPGNTATITHGNP